MGIVHPDDHGAVVPLQRRDIMIAGEAWDVALWPGRPETSPMHSRPPFVGLEFTQGERVVRLPLSMGSIPSEREFMAMTGVQLRAMLARAGGGA